MRPFARVRGKVEEGDGADGVGRFVSEGERERDALARGSSWSGGASRGALVGGTGGLGRATASWAVVLAWRGGRAGRLGCCGERKKLGRAGKRRGVSGLG